MLQPTFSSVETRRSWLVATVALLIMATAFGAPWITLVALKDIAAEVRGERSIPALAIDLARFARSERTVNGVPESNDIDRVVRARLRSLRTTLGLSLDGLAARANLSPSTISRIETGKRAISLDVLLPLARALQVDLDSLLRVHSNEDVVIHPVPSRSPGRTTWMLSRPTDNTIASKWVYCWNWFGGVQTVTAGTFTINWNASGIFAVTCT